MCAFCFDINSHFNGHQTNRKWIVVLCYFLFRIFFLFVTIFFFNLVDLDWKMLLVSGILNSWVLIEMSLNSMFLFWKCNHTIFNLDVFPALYFQFETFFFCSNRIVYVCVCVYVHCQKHWINRQFHCFHILYRTGKKRLKLKEGGQNCRIQQLCCLQIKPGTSASFWFTM